jgi:hypothetical protein
MAHSYTARQLDFFKSTLKIIESALFEAESVTATLGELPAAAIESTPGIMAVEEPLDSHGVSRALFSVMPQPDEPEPSSVTRTPAIEPVIISLSDVKNSHAFFSQLPWHAVSKKSTPASHSRVIELNDTPAPVAQTASVLASATPPNCSAFFSALPWQGIASHAAIKQQPAPLASVIEISQPTMATTPNNSCLNFFNHLPWQGQPASDTNGNLHSDEFATIAALATQSALTAASRAVNQQSPATATGFFQALPW